jgi:hypothetical protein
MARLVEKRKRLRVVLLTAGVTLALTLGTGEIVTRCFLRSRWNTANLREQLKRVSIRSLIDFDDDPQVMYKLRSGLDTELQESRVLTDESGVRVGTASPGVPEQSIRVALIGDSSSFGWRVNYEDSFGEKLRSALEVMAGSPVVLRNYSVPGYNASQEFHVFVNKILAFNPGLLIVLHDHNDSQPTGWGYVGWMPPEYGDNVLHSALLKVVLRQLKKMKDKPVLMEADGQNEYMGEYCVKGPLYEVMMESRRALMEAAHARGIPVLIVVFNANVAADDDYVTSDTYLRLHKNTSDRFRQMGYEVLDLYPQYQQMLKQAGMKDMHTLWVDAEDHHPNPLGHTFIAEVLLRHIEATPQLKRVFVRSR